jgi:hypothetical protein
VTHVKLLSLGIDSQPEEIRLVVAEMRIQLAPGVHLDLSKASSAACREIAGAFERAARMKDFQTLPEVA